MEDVSDTLALQEIEHLLSRHCENNEADREHDHEALARIRALLKEE